MAATHRPAKNAIISCEPPSADRPGAEVASFYEQRPVGKTREIFVFKCDASLGTESIRAFKNKFDAYD
jgi:hypothetical protein